MKWKTKDGRMLSVNEMDDKHLLNAFAYMMRSFRQDYRVNWFPKITGLPAHLKLKAIRLEMLYKELTKRGLPWSDETAHEQVLGAGDAALSSLVVSAAVARSPGRKLKVKPLPEPQLAYETLSIDLGDEK